MLMQCERCPESTKHPSGLCIDCRNAAAGIHCDRTLSRRGSEEIGRPVRGTMDDWSDPRYWEAKDDAEAAIGG